MRQYFKDDYLNKQIELIRKHAINAVHSDISAGNARPHPFGHAFLYADIEVELRNGKKKKISNVLLGASICTDDISRAEMIVNQTYRCSNASHRMD